MSRTCGAYRLLRSFSTCLPVSIGTSPSHGVWPSFLSSSRTVASGGLLVMTSLTVVGGARTGGGGGGGACLTAASTGGGGVVAEPEPACVEPLPALAFL